MKLLVFGATGMAGERVVEMALERGHQVIAFVRDPAKLTATHANLKSVTGDILDAGTLDAAFAEPVDAVVSTLGIFHREPRTELSDGTRNIVDAMTRHNVRRIAVVSTIGAGETRGQGNLIARFLQRFLLAHVIDDKNRQETLLAQSSLDWTIVRPPQLTNASNVCQKPVIWQGPPPASPKLAWKTSRGTVAYVLLESLEKGLYIHQAINISEPK